MGYLANFLVYTFAMVGVIVAALLIFKNSTSIGGGKKSKYLKVIDSMSLAPRKTLYIVSTGSEKFLLAADVDKTTLISKLDGMQVLENDKTFKETLDSLPNVKEMKINNIQKPSFMDKSNIANLGIKSSMLNPDGHQKSVIKSLAERIR